MTTISNSSGAIPYRDRATQIDQYVQFWNRRDDVAQKTVAEATAEFDHDDALKLRLAQLNEASLNGEGTYLGSSKNNQAVWDPEGYKQDLEQMRAVRSKPYSMMAGPASIEALDVNSAVKAQGHLTGGDLHNLTRYAAYLRNEVAAASSVKSDVRFTGGWGKDRVTHDVNEYVGWLMQAAQQISQRPPD